MRRNVVCWLLLRLCLAYACVFDRLFVCLFVSLCCNVQPV